MDQTSSVDFVARYRWPLRFVPIALLLVAVYVAPRSMVEWAAQTAFLQAGFLFMATVIIASFGEVMIRKTVFFADRIERRTMIRRRLRRSYEDIRSIESRQKEFLDVKFSDGMKLRIWALEADLPVLQALLVSRIEASPDGRYVEPAG